MIRYCTFGKSGIDDFRSVILPNIWEQLLLTEDFEAEGLKLIGVLDGDEPVAALVARFLQNEEVYVNSLYVNHDHRLQGIGAHMIKDLCALASDTYTHATSEDFPLFIHTEYVLPEDEAEGFETFLKKQGFRDFLPKGATYLFEKSDIAEAVGKAPAPSKDVKRVTETAEYDEALFGQVFEAAGFMGDPAYCFFHQGKDGADFLAAAIEMGLNDFYIVTAGEEADAAACEETVTAMLRALCDDCGAFSVIADTEAAKDLPLWSLLAKNGGTVCRRQEAGMYAVFDA